MSSMVQRVVFLAVIAGSFAVHAQSKGNCGKPPKFKDLPGASSIGPIMSSEPSDPWATKAFPEHRWRVTGVADQYTAGMDYQTTRDGQPSGYIRSLGSASRGPVSVTQKRDAEKLRGKRIRVAGWVRAEGLTGDAGLWLSVDGGDKPTLAFDNLSHRADKARDWTWSEVVLDVPSDATILSFGLGLGAAGQAWVNGLKVEEVDSSQVPTTEVGI